MQTTSSRCFRPFQANRLSSLRRGIGAAILLGAVAFINLLVVSPVTAVSGAVVKVDPASSTVNVGETSVVNIRIENVTNLAGAEIHLTYDSTLLEAKSIQADGFSMADYVVQSSATGGKIDYTIAQMPPHTPVSGGGALFQIAFKGLAAGTGTLHFTSAILSDGSGAIIPSTTQDGTFIINQSGGGVNGRVLRQGISPSTGPGTQRCTLITVRCDSLSTSPITAPFCTDEGGYFNVPIPSGRKCTIGASYPGYLPAEIVVSVPDGQVENIGTAKLFGGDVNTDGKINILDIVAIINSLSATGLPPDDPRDINDDGAVNISDLAIAAGNFGKVGPTFWQP